MSNDPIDSHGAGSDRIGDEEEEFVKLVSAEGHEFIVPRRIALVSKTMRAMLEGNFREAEDSVIRFPDISGHVLEKVIQYLHYQVRYNNSTARIPEFKIEPELALELLVASNFLDC
jgi:transcription elongation factor B subunit 1